MTIFCFQNGKNTFNRAMLFNIGFTEALKLEQFDCFFLHDVDHLPENDRWVWEFDCGIDYLLEPLFHFCVCLREVGLGLWVLRKKRKQNLWLGQGTSVIN